jgi:zinc/manganese transport system substrate-binding protein
VANTEPVPHYLLDASGLVNKTPEKFSAAIEEGTDVSPELLKQTLDLFGRHQVKLLAYNEQTSGPETEAVLAAAKSAGIPVVPVTETLPKGKDYLAWMTDNLAAVTAALK